jgi:Regulator of chromosome condensation (RCC1) repeat
MFASRNWFSNRTRIRWAFLLPGLLLVAASAVAAPMRYELDLTPTATHAANSWDHNVPLNGPFNCDSACHTGAAGDFAPSGSIHTPTQSGTFLLNALKVRYYGDSSNVKDYPDNVTGDTLTAQGHYLSGGRATVTVPLAREKFLHVRSVAVGQSVCAVLASGAVTCWGRNRFGGLGDGTDQDSNLPVATFAPANVRQVAAHFRHSCAVTGDGAVWCWGANYTGELGSSDCPWQTDFGDCFNPNPSQVVGLPGPAASVAVGGSFNSTDFSCANLLAGSVWCWGGDNVKAIGANNDSACALRSDKTVWCWGTSLQGPAQVQNLNAVTAVSGSCAVRAGGTVWCWYAGTASQVAGLSGVTSISDSKIYSDPYGCAVRSDGSVWCWGAPLIPSQVNGLSGITAISRGGDYSDVICAVRYDGTVWCLNDNGWGQLGNPTVEYSADPVPVLSGSESHRVYTGSFDSVDALVVTTDNSHHSIGIGSGWPSPSSGNSANSPPPPPFSPTYPGGIMSDQYPCDPGNPDDYGCGSNPSAIDSYDLRSPLVSATGHKISNQDFPSDFPAKNGPLWLVGGGSIEIDPISPTDAEHSSVGYTGAFSATALTPMTGLSVTGGATGATAAAAVAFEGKFALGTGGKAFTPAADDIVIGYGPYTAYLPAGTLESEGSGASYSGQINGSPMQISIRHLRDGSYAFSVAAQSVDLHTLIAPSNLDLYIGDNAGSAPAMPRH